MCLDMLLEPSHVAECNVLGHVGVNMSGPMYNILC